MPSDEVALRGTAHLLRVVDADGRTTGPACLVTDTLAVTVADVTGTALRVTVQPVPGGPGAGSTAGIVADVTSALTLLELAEPIPGTRPARFAAEPPEWGRAVDVLGYPHRIDTGAWARPIVRGALPSGAVQLDPEPGGYPLGDGFAGAAVQDIAGRVLGLIGDADDTLIPARTVLDAVARLAGEPGLAGLAIPRSPFLGLAPYGESDAGIFPMRRAESAAVAGLLRDHRWVSVVGEPGCGKSSLIGAGVVPVFREQGYAISTIRGSVRETEPEPGDLTRRIDREIEANRDGRHLLVLDQVEEILAAPGGEEALGRAMSADLPSATRVVLAMRPDTWGTLLGDERYARLTAPESTYTLSPLDGAALRTVLTAAEQETQAAYEDGLTDLILRDLEPASTPLPLLGYLMERLWDRCWADSRQAGAPFVLTHAAYHSLGGVTGAIGERAEQVWAELTDEEKEHCRGLLRRLVHIPEADAAPVRRTASRSDMDPGQWRIAQRLAGERLLAVHGDAGEETVEVVHEVLMRQWDRYARWIDDDRAFLLWRAGLARDIERWEDHDRGDVLLPGEAALGEAGAQERAYGAVLDARERAYLAAGRAVARRRARNRLIRHGGLTTLAAVVVILATLGVVGIVDAHRNTALAESHSLVREAQDAEESDGPLSVMTALAAYQVAPNRESRNQLMRTYWGFRDAARLVAPANGDSTSDTSDWEQSRDGDVAIEVSGYAVDVQTRILSGPLKRHRVALSKEVAHAELAADGRRVVVFFEDGGGAWFDIDPGPQGGTGPVRNLPSADVRPPPRKDQEPIKGDAFKGQTMEGLWGWSVNVEPAISADGRYVVARVWNRIVVWDLAAGNGGAVTRRLPAVRHTVWKLWFAAGSKALIAQVLDNKASHLVSIDVAGGAVHRVTPSVDQPVLSGDGTTAVTCRRRGTGVVYERFRATDGKRSGAPYATSSTSGCTTPVTTGAAARYLCDGGTLVDLARGKVISWLHTSHDIQSLFEHGGKLYGATDIGAHAYVEVPWSGKQEEGATWVKLAEDGTRMYSILSDGRLSVTGRGGRELAVTDRLKPTWRFQGSDHIGLDSTGRRLLEREGRNIVAVRDARTLKLITTIRTWMPRITRPVSELFSPVTDPGPEIIAPQTSTLGYYFDQNDVVTVSDSVVQRWNAANGKQITRLDIARYRPKAGKAELVAGAGPRHGTIAVNAVGEPGVTVVDLASGEVSETIRTPDTIAARFDPTGRYMALERSGSILELWRLHPLRKVIGPLPSIVESTRVPFVAGFTGNNGRFYLGTRNTLSVYGIEEGGLVDSYQFADPTADEGNGAFMDVTKNLGFVVRFDPDGSGGPLSLNPATWRARLCGMLGGRDFTDAELARLPGTVHRGQICGGVKVSPR